ncbi:SusC/RagA family TonB-linked outer membrane protein [Mucilaginibacter phyllosphaerae]|uniref:TonB-dependent receptor n=1 Tax=Mucilaginibacter phyllosphaerae TaxID=1812349 RepID=A0A4Y8AKW1_9SPHI|nr:TonB-dependent receptor [Mucilaginibacter phyllosphaerae]MBB3967703.1 TonB-linked SusC/RagA family outer membrane protein [Mucilaginibacter phyllosphaerae]TEW69242.1 TonB-dependent receptor [Mucilaginibacter phyllosphaerae]GGH03885.1 SusC/RagA family TonB-linked outer membrane protein [Mucilaginibacter phyllosphaerae]
MSKLRLIHLRGKLLCAILSLLTLCCFTNVRAQGIIGGVVKDLKGAPIPGVTVAVKGTATAVSTNYDGKFSITAGPTAVLRFSMVGFDAQEVTVGNQQQISIVLKESNKGLQEVVVIGYGTKKKIDLTGTVNSLQADEIVKARATGTQEAMQGRLPGVDIRRSSGKPGSDFSIEIRGANSITGSTQPLYVIDGIPVAQNGSATNPVNDLNPADIERIDVLKDASSTAIYGSRGANGVVLVTTKRGSKGSVKITYDGYSGIVNPYNLPPVMNGPTFVNYARDYYNELAQATALRNGTPLPTTPVADDKIFSATELTNIAAGKYTNWVDLITKNGVSANHNLSISGGDEKTTYFVGAGYQLYEGTTQGVSTKKYTLKAGLDKNINNTFKVGGSIYSTFADIHPGSAEVFRSTYRLRPTGSAYDAAGNKRFFTYEGETQITNPLFEADNEIRQQQYVHVLPNVYAEANIIRGLKLRSSFSPDLTFQRQGQYNDMFSKQQLGTRPNSASNSSNQWVNYTWDNLLSYTNEFGKHKFDITLGNTFEYHQQDFSSSSVQGLPFRSLWYNVQSVTTVNGIAPIISVSSGYSKQTIASYYGRANYTFNNRYLFTATLRTDQNSIFAPGHQRGWFPSAAASWILSEEDFVKNIRAINLLKLRLSYGKSGNAALSQFLYPYVTQSLLNSVPYDFNGVGASGFTPAFGNKNLTWEKTDEYNLGLDMQLFENRIGLQLDLYSKKSKGSIIYQNVPPPNGYPGTTTNLGSVGNKGIEVGLNTVNVRSSKFSWTTNINFAVNKNKILELYGDGKDDIGNARFIGQKTRVVYRYKIIGVWQNDEADQAKTFNRIPGQYKIQDFSGPAGVPDGKIDSYDRQILGSDIPNWFGGLTNTINFANLDFSFTVYTRQGTFQNSVFLEQVMNGDQGRARFGAFDRSYWTPTNPSNTWANTARETDGDARTAAQFQNTSYTKISNITLGYTIPKSLLNKVKIQGLRVYANAFNPFIFTKFIGWDPENPDGSSFNNQDFRTRTFMLGVNLTL